MPKVIEVFDPEIRNFTLNTLRQLGYTVTTRSSAGGFGATEIIRGKHKDGLKRFVAEATQPSHPTLQQASPVVEYNFLVKKRSSASGYTELFRTFHMLTLDEVRAYFEQYAKIVGSIDTTGYPEPRQFLPQAMVSQVLTGNNRRPRVVCINNSQLQQVAVMSIVTINHGFNTVDITGSCLNHPNTRCWFLLDCTGYRGARFNLISDGQEYHVVDRVSDFHTKTKIRQDVDKVTVSADKISSIDKELINRAITLWVETFMS